MIFINVNINGQFRFCDPLNRLIYIPTHKSPLKTTCGCCGDTLAPFSGPQLVVSPQAQDFQDQEGFT